MRPPYSRALLDRAQEVLELDAAARVLDLAAGTGRLTRELARRFAEVVAVEPDERMRAVHGAALAGSAEAIPLDDGSVDAVFVGEAFHWFDPAAAIARARRACCGRAAGWRSSRRTGGRPSRRCPSAALELLSEPYERFRPQRRPPWDDAFAESPFEPLRYERPRTS